MAPDTLDSRSGTKLPALDQPLPQGEAKGEAVQAMFDTIAPRYDLVNRIMTFRLDVRWRRIAIASLELPANSRIVDLATGTGDFCRELAEHGHRSIGADFSFGMLAAARTAEPLVQGDGMQLPFATASVDGATCGFALRNLSTFNWCSTNSGVSPGRVDGLPCSMPANPITHSCGQGMASTSGKLCRSSVDSSQTKRPMGTSHDRSNTYHHDRNCSQ